MEEGVKSLERGQLRRNGQHQLRVHDRNFRKSVFVAEPDFLLAVGDHGPRVGFRSGSRGGGDRDDRKRQVRNGLRLSAAAGDIVPVVARIGRHDRDCLGSVDRAAAAEAENEVASLPFGERGAFHDLLFGRVGLNFVVDGGLYFVVFQ
ncbi:hypothetical protein SDC9_180000 [bioreactor metagenome]|uniref:Uncharacterized protein n=1 Tax=bioreactor metagenome TaxID=1076179 RepID=A0A645H0D9_9ZZZZ